MLGLLRLKASGWSHRQEPLEIQVGWRPRNHPRIRPQSQTLQLLFLFLFPLFLLLLLLLWWLAVKGWLRPPLCTKRWVLLLAHLGVLNLGWGSQVQLHLFIVGDGPLLWSRTSMSRSLMRKGCSRGLGVPFLAGRHYKQTLWPSVSCLSLAGWQD